MTGERQFLKDILRESRLRVLDVERMLVEEPPPPKGGVVYFAHAIGTPFVKVGWTAHDPSECSMWTAALARINDLRTGCPHELRLVRVMEGSRDDESQVHGLLADRRVRGEWFALAGSEVG
jgi:hypothetical protein